MPCINCGGSLIGDGHTSPVHCENVDIPMDLECDADIVYCEPINEEDSNEV